MGYGFLSVANVEDGHRGIAFIAAAVVSSAQEGSWVDF
jgi:hypothetical protein